MGRARQDGRDLTVWEGVAHPGGPTGSPHPQRGPARQPLGAQDTLTFQPPPRFWSPMFWKVPYRGYFASRSLWLVALPRPWVWAPGG